MAGFGWSSFSAPTRNYGGIRFDQTPSSDWSEWLKKLNNPYESDALGLGVNGDDNAFSNEAWNRWLSSQANSLSPNAMRGLSQNRGMFDTAYHQARAGQPELRFAQFLGGVNSGDTLTSMSPQQAFRPVQFYRVRASLNN